MGRIVLITGASSGMGREASILLARGGHTVYASARRASRMDDLSEHGITPIEMDVSKGGDNERAVRHIVDRRWERPPVRPRRSQYFPMPQTLRDHGLRDTGLRFQRLSSPRTPRAAESAAR